MNERKDIMDSIEEAILGESVSPHFGTASEVVERYCHCALCGANLHFSHVTDFIRNLTQEIARCPECGIKAREATHKLQ